MSTPHTLIGWVPVMLLLLVGCISFIQRRFYRSDFLQSRILTRKLGRYPSSLPYRCFGLDFLLDLSVGEFIMCFIFFGWILLRWGLFHHEFPAWSAGSRYSNVRAPGFRPLGEVNFYTLGFILFPVARNSIWLQLLGISVERAIKFHRWWGRTALVVMGVHGFGMWANFAEAKSDPLTEPFSFVLKMEKNPLTGWSNLSGFLSFLCILIMASLAYEPVRRKKFEWFYFTHLVLFIPALVFAYLHMPSLIGWIAPALAMYILDIGIRIMRTRFQGAECISAQALPGGVTALTVRKPKGFKYEPGQFCFVRVLNVSQVESHPFSLSSAPAMGDDSQPFCFHLKDMGPGTFTNLVRELVNKSSADSGASARSPTAAAAATRTEDAVELGTANPAAAAAPATAEGGSPKHAETVELIAAGSVSSSNQLQVQIDGPYGKPAIPIFSKANNYKALLLVCGGVGITPCASILAFFLDQKKRNASANLELKTDKIVLLWSNPDPVPFTWFADLLQRARTECPDAVELHLNITKSKEGGISLPVLRGLPFSYGRASVKDALVKVSQGSPALPKSIGVFVCGPQPMVDSVQQAAFDQGPVIDFHKETFFL